MKEPFIDFKPTLPEVHSRFVAWRKTKKHRGRRIPEDLWVAAVLLTPDNSTHKVSRALSLSYKELKKRVESHKTITRSSPSPSPDFIPIDIPQQHSAECIIEMAHHNGNKMRMHFKGNAELDLQSFAESFWVGRK